MCCAMLYLRVYSKFECHNHFSGKHDSNAKCSSGVYLRSYGSMCGVYLPSYGSVCVVCISGSIMDSGQDPQLSKHSDISTLRQTLDTVVRAHYPAMHGHLATRMVPCPSVCSDALGLLSG